MLLSKLENQSFKSFGDKMVMQLRDKGITGVVSKWLWKSNVVDCLSLGARGAKKTIDASASG